MTPGCEWVLAGGEDVSATVKYDGVCVMLGDDGRWWARRSIKTGHQVPENYVPVAHDLATGKTFGWVPSESSTHHVRVTEALGYTHPLFPHSESGTYELIGPKINKNPHNTGRHILVRHGSISSGYVPTGNEDLGLYLALVSMAGYFEGVVWHHSDGRMAKIKTKDFA